MLRPDTIADVAKRMLADMKSGKQDLDVMLYWMSAFRHEVKDRDAGWVRAAIEQEPAHVSELVDASLAAAAEYLAHKHGVLVPDWIDAPERFLAQPVVSGRSRAAQDYMREHTPQEWSRRGIYCGETSL